MKVLAHLAGALILAGLVFLAVQQWFAGQLLFQVPFILFLATTLTVGWILCWKLPRHPLGWLLIVIVGLFASQAPTSALADVIRPELPDAAVWLYWWGSSRQDTWAWVPSIALLFTQVPLRFPTGALPSRNWRWFSWFTIAATILTSAGLATSAPEVMPGIPNPTYVAWNDEDSSILLIVCLGLLLLPSFIGSLASLFVRYHRGTSRERAQLRWVFWGACIPIVALASAWVIPISPLWTAIQPWVLATYALIPISILFAVLRYRLYDIDRIISRTASYALVSVVVIGVYLLVVTSVHWILPDLPAIGVALATLAGAALFLPVLRWVRRLVDRRFDRERYDAEKVVDAFGEHLRTDLDPHSTAGELLEAVDKTLQPAAVGLWTVSSRS
jgi:hypothetical protein